MQVAFHGESQLPQSHATQPLVHAECFSVSTIHPTLTWTTRSLACAQMLMHATAHQSVQTPKESLHRKLTVGKKKILCRTGKSNLHQRCASLTLNQLSYTQILCCQTACNNKTNFKKYNSTDCNRHSMRNKKPVV